MQKRVGKIIYRIKTMINLILITIVVCIYFLPTIISHNKKHTLGIAILNLFLGWTFLGWVGALIWAVSSPKNVETVKIPFSWYDTITLIMLGISFLIITVILSNKSLALSF